MLDNRMEGMILIFVFYDCIEDRVVESGGYCELVGWLVSSLGDFNVVPVICKWALKESMVNHLLCLCRTCSLGQHGKVFPFGYWCRHDWCELLLSSPPPFLVA